MLRVDPVLAHCFMIAQVYALNELEEHSCEAYPERILQHKGSSYTLRRPTQSLKSAEGGVCSERIAWTERRTPVGGMERRRRRDFDALLLLCSCLHEPAAACEQHDEAATR